MKEKTVHVIKWRKNRWAIALRRASQVLKIFDEKTEAISAGNEFLDEGYTLVVHRKDASVEYWKDPEH